MNILFVCNGNVARSQEAEIFFNTLRHDEQSMARSCGINIKPGKPIDPLVVEVMGEIGYDTSSAWRKEIDETMVAGTDLIISFKPKAELPEYIRRCSNVRYWDIADPRQQPIEFFREIRDSVKKNVEELINELRV